MCVCTRARAWALARDIEDNWNIFELFQASRQGKMKHEILLQIVRYARIFKYYSSCYPDF